MKEKKFKEKFENAFGSFFCDEKLDENFQLDFYGNQTILENEKSQNIVGNIDLIKLFKEVFLFLPSALLLFIGSIGFTWRLFLPISEGVERFSMLNFIALLILSLITILGLGNLRNPKHLSIPLSIIATGVMLSVIDNVFFGGFGGYLPYFFPLALIVSVFEKNWIYLKSEEAK